GLQCILLVESIPFLPYAPGLPLRARISTSCHSCAALPVAIVRGPETRMTVLDFLTSVGVRA
ncbi:MAG: hypothetical protein ACXW02_04640, partial [Halobacteriota archaeon]